tara:strand:- start:416 stop:664 length:249 start_codon:yes stop_codon:yes gene_type:complete
MAHIVKAEAWDNFNPSIYAQRVKINDVFQSLYQIKYNYFKNSREMNNPIQAVEYIVAYDKDEAIKTWGKWKDLIIKIEKINP